MINQSINHDVVSLQLLSSLFSPLLLVGGETASPADRRVGRGLQVHSVQPLATGGCHLDWTLPFRQIARYLACDN